MTSIFTDGLQNLPLPIFILVSWFLAVSIGPGGKILPIDITIITIIIESVIITVLILVTGVFAPIGENYFSNYINLNWLL